MTLPTDTVKSPLPIDEDAVPVATAPNPIVAHILRSILDDAGIPAMVAGEHAASLLPHWGTAISVTVLVPRNDYARAVAAIEESVRSATPSRCAACGYDLEGLEQQNACPECGSKYEDLRRRVAIAPPPKAGKEPIARIGAILGMLVIAIVVAAIAGVTLWGLRALNSSP